SRDEFQQDVWDGLAAGMHYVSTEFDSESGEDSVAKLLDSLDEELDLEGNRVYYLAVPPQAIGTLVREIGERRRGQGWTRLIVEKPFGHDRASARALNEEILQTFGEDEI